MGEIVANWKVQDGLTQEITIPPNATAIVYVPAIDVGQVTESGRPATQAVGIHFLRLENGNALFSVGSGSYRFAVPARGLNAHALRLSRQGDIPQFSAGSISTPIPQGGGALVPRRLR
jgi:flagellar basal body rod protein FlgG